nr:hypothetical protein [Rhizobium leguminosarum]
MLLESRTVPMTSEREIVSSNQKITGTRGFPTGCFAYADDELSGKLVFSGAREGVSIGLSKSSSIHLSVKYLWLLVGNWAPLCLVIGHIKFWSKNTLSTLLLDAGFDNVRFEYVGRIPVFAKSMIAVAQKPLREVLERP